MRITTQMLNQSARKAGLPINRTSLLNYIKGNSSTAMAGALNKNSAAGAAAKTRYEKLEKAASQLSEAASAFMATGEDSLFSKAKESGDNQGICDAAEGFVKKYNSMLSALKNASSALNDYYSQMMKSAAFDNKEALGSIGITVAKDGLLSINKDKLKEADIDTLEKVLGNTTGFTKKAAYVAGRVSDNAQASQNSMSSKYSSAGTLYSALASKYDLFG